MCLEPRIWGVVSFSLNRFLLNLFSDLPVKIEPSLAGCMCGSYSYGVQNCSARYNRQIRCPQTAPIPLHRLRVPSFRFMERQSDSTDSPTRGCSVLAADLSECFRQTRSTAPQSSRSSSLFPQHLHNAHNTHHPPHAAHRHVTSQTRHVTSQTRHVASQTRHVTSQTRHVTSQTRHVTSQTRHVTSQTRHVTSQTRHITSQTRHLTSQTRHVTSQTRHE